MFAWGMGVAALIVALTPSRNSKFRVLDLLCAAQAGAWFTYAVMH